MFSPEENLFGDRRGKKLKPVIGFSLLGYDRMLRGVRFNSKSGGGGSRPYPSYEEFQAGLARADAERNKWFEDLNSRDLGDVSGLVSSTNRALETIQDNKNISPLDKLLLTLGIIRARP